MKPFAAPIYFFSKKGTCERGVSWGIVCQTNTKELYLHVHHLLGIFVDVGQITGKQAWGNNRFVRGSHDDDGDDDCCCEAIGLLGMI